MMPSTDMCIQLTSDLSVKLKGGCPSSHPRLLVVVASYQSVSSEGGQPRPPGDNLADAAPQLFVILRQTDRRASRPGFLRWGKATARVRARAKQANKQTSRWTEEGIVMDVRVMCASHAQEVGMGEWSNGRSRITSYEILYSY